ncbi:Zinc finger CCCH domain-containing protein 14 [Armadillidium nasatum]|uniref:Zinc finger CCCH domain-containing protein 14 n=1 Tax=Armadillidium nasatum TaxID=96803 RepID=A0A5N5SL50_9CRUS|nr:Zinc finger CCCH domain-containing protein 14 [Armadillidium nasatum]
MILVGNGKTKDQMDDDLSLFLGHNTERFTSWLHEVLQRLNAASILQKENKVGKEKKKEEEKEKEKTSSDAEEPKVPKVVEEKKKHKKKKDKSEKKKEKKEKKKKKDKEKHSKSQKHKGKETSKSKSRSPILLKIGSVSGIKSNEESEAASHSVKDDEIPSDVVNLRPNAVIKEIKEKDQKISSSPEHKIISTVTNIEIKVDNPRAKESNLSATSDDEVSSTGIHERLGPKRVINLREESSFPPKSSGAEEGMGRVISSAIASAVKSVSSDVKPSKRLEARVRPLVSSRIKEPEEEVDDVALPPARLVSTVGAVLKRSHSNDDSDNDEEPPTKRVVGIASKVEVTPRPRRTGAQANTALILRAVADAHKSVNKPSKKILEDKDEGKMVKKEIFTRSYQERQSHRLGASSEGKTLKKFAITVPNSLLKENVNMKIAEKPALADSSYVDEVEMEGSGDLDSEMEHTETRLKSKIMPQVKTLSTSKVLPMQVDETSGSTRFIVTLDGFGNEVTSSDLRSKLRGRPVGVPSVDDEQEIIEEVEEWEEEVEEMELGTPQSVTGHDGVSSTLSSMVPKWKTKIDASDLVSKKEERCRYWPACKEGTACIFIHPSKICNTFPNCRFGEKCLYIHPNCKFDGACTKLNCPFTHSVSRSLAIPTPVATKAKINPKSKIKCKYYPKCTDMNCPFMHPKQICRYGKKCQTTSCLFVHPDVTTGSLLKWTAPKQTAKPAAGSPIKLSTATEASSVTSSNV